MKTKVFLTTALFLIVTATTFAQSSEKLGSSNTHIRFLSTTPAEDIEANNYSSTGALNKTTGEIVFSVPMQGFEFEKRMMQKHFNNKKFHEPSYIVSKKEPLRNNSLYFLTIRQAVQNRSTDKIRKSYLLIFPK